LPEFEVEKNVQHWIVNLNIAKARLGESPGFIG
jgi:hypothetical protein